MSASKHSLVEMASAADRADRARLCHDAGLTTQAAALLREAMSIDPTLLEARLLEARVRLATTRERSRTMAASQAPLTPKPPRDRDATAELLNRSQRLWEAGQYELARAALPDKPAGRFDLLRRQAALDLLLGRTQAAEAELRAWLEQQADAQAVRRTLARLTAQSRPREGVELMLGARPSAMPAYLRYWAACVLARGRVPADAERLVVDLLEDQPHDAALWVLAGRLAERTGQDAVATHRLETAARQGRVAAAARSLMRLHLRAGRFTAAGAWAFRRLRGGRPLRSTRQQAEAWTVLAISAAMAGHRRLARRARRAARDCAGRVGWHALRRQMWGHAAAGLVLVATLEQDEQPPQISSRPAQSPLQRLLDFACVRLNAHAALWPNRADVFYHLANCRQALGEVDAAAAANDAALSLNPHYRRAIDLQQRLTHAAIPGSDRLAA